MVGDNKPAELRANHDPYGAPPLADDDRVRRTAPSMRTPPSTTKQKALAILIVAIVVAAIVIGALR
ncbi:hypothetical protein [Salinispora arenicola]|uniref:hypothetical protein n=1 Tax=Salinispora arenicola TaxID=168697 RepID=UPI000477C803|nr:hypothetical protein [Salinispora arenicola]